MLLQQLSGFSGSLAHGPVACTKFSSWGGLPEKNRRAKSCLPSLNGRCRALHNIYTDCCTVIDVRRVPKGAEVTRYYNSDVRTVLGSDAYKAFVVIALLHTLDHTDSTSQASQHGY